MKLLKLVLHCLTLDLAQAELEDQIKKGSCSNCGQDPMRGWRGGAL